MADFNEAYNKTILGNEGGLNPGDGEAFTYRGIDESQNPHWPGFLLVHSIYDENKQKGIEYVNSILLQNTDLQKHIQDFYRVDYWNILGLYLINDQQIANLLFDDAVNPCEISCAKLMQTACVLCNVPVVVDGVIGNNTITAINAINPVTYYNAVIGIRTFHYNHEVIKHPQQRQWLKIWLARLVKYK